jgi:hypothetical protein
MNLSELAIEIAKPEYDNLTDQEICDQINQATYIVWIDVPTSVLAGACELTFWNESELDQGFIFEHVETLAAAGNAVAKKLMRMLTGQTAVSSFEMSNPNKRQIIEGMLAQFKALQSHPMSELAADSLLNLAKTSVAKFNLFASREVDHGDIKKARGENWEEYIVKPGSSNHQYDPTLVNQKKSVYKTTYDQAIEDGKSSVLAEQEAQLAASMVAP